MPSIRVVSANKMYSTHVRHPNYHSDGGYSAVSEKQCCASLKEQHYNIKRIIHLAFLLALGQYLTTGTLYSHIKYPDITYAHLLLG